MAAQDPRELTHRIYRDIFNAHDASQTDRYVTPDYRDNSGSYPPGYSRDREGFKKVLQTLFEAFPDVHYTVDDVIVEGDRAVVRVTGTGTNRGSYFGMPPTGKRATWTEIHIGRDVDGKLAEHWGEIDQLSMLQQLGVIPMPGQERAA